MPIPSEATQHYQECFNWFDKDGDKKIRGIDLPNALRAMGQLWSFNELQELQRTYPPDQEITFDRFLQIAETKHGQPIDTDKIGQAFDVLDRSRCGRVYADDLRHILTSVGEKLTREEFEELCAINGIQYRGGDQTFDRPTFYKLFGANKHREN